ncbi:MAG TPA: HesA/MoeB/ThiF family protein, partial [Polyangia bacterium]|nr:HesA/MoeB/ThiF family protein [Polyangia bacterium]
MSESRYRRQVLVEGIGEAGQAALCAAKVAVVGCGALGCAILDQLARAGVGYLRIIDPDVPEISNLQRQVLIDEDDVAARRPKALAAANRISRANSEVTVDPRVTRLEAGNATELLFGVDLVLDGTDNFAARYLINRTCVASRTPWIFGGVLAANGMSFPSLPGGPCLRCALGEEPPEGVLPTTAERGVLSAVVQTVASLEVV